MAAAVCAAYRFLHVCYCCADTEPVVAFLTQALALDHTMGSPVAPSSGAILGVDGDVVTGSAFLYDTRGPRVSPAIEVQSWIDPPLVGQPSSDPSAAGIRALGVAVPDVRAAEGRLTSLGCSTLPAVTADWLTMGDPRGVTLDLAEDRSLARNQTRMRHLRLTCTDLAASLTWYEGLGFEVVGKAGISGAESVCLRLADEAFEVVLVEWSRPPSHGRHPRQPNHAGLFRTAIAVEDTQASYETLCAAGWSFDSPPMSVALKGTPVPDLLICFLSDPDGVPFELVGRPKAAFRS